MYFMGQDYPWPNTTFPLYFSFLTQLNHFNQVQQKWTMLVNKVTDQLHHEGHRKARQPYLCFEEYCWLLEELFVERLREPLNFTRSHNEDSPKGQIFQMASIHNLTLFSWLIPSTLGHSWISCLIQCFFCRSIISQEWKSAH